jgi:hypothetical protein
MSKNYGIIIILVSVGLVCLSILFTSNFGDKQIVLKKGEYIPSTVEYDYDIESDKDLFDQWLEQLEKEQGNYWEGTVTIQLKHILSLCVIAILFGIGVVLFSKKGNHPKG